MCGIYIMNGVHVPEPRSLYILLIMGKFDWGVWYIIIFLYVQFWTRLAAASYRGKKVRTVAFLAVRSVNKPRDTRHCVKKTSQSMQSVSSSPLVHITKLWLNFVLSDIANTPQFQSSCRWPLWCYRSPQDVSTGHGRCHDDNPWHFCNKIASSKMKLGCASAMLLL